MDQVEVEIIGMAITSRYGTLLSGAILRTDLAYATHLVEDCFVAKWKTPQKVRRAADTSAAAAAAAAAAADAKAVADAQPAATSNAAAAVPETQAFKKIKKPK